MWPFKKPELNGNLIVSVRYMYSDCSMDISDKFMKTLTRKQIRMLNNTRDIRHDEISCDADLLNKQEKLAEKDRIKKVAKQKLAYHMAEELDHNISGGEEYKQYFNNNLGKTVLTEDEEKRVMEMLGEIATKKEEIEEKIGKLPRHTIWFNRNEMENIMTELLTKSASNDNKK